MNLSKKIKALVPGDVYGEWTVISYAGNKGKGHNAYWTCQCSCGRLKEVNGSTLRTGKTVQCQKCTGKTNGRIGLYSQGKHQHLYIIRCGEYFKIGVSDNPERRIKDFKSANPYPLEILYIGMNEGHEEKLWHDIFAHRHHHGEWFKA